MERFRIWVVVALLVCACGKATGPEKLTDLRRLDGTVQNDTVEEGVDTRASDARTSVDQGTGDLPGLKSDLPSIGPPAVCEWATEGTVPLDKTKFDADLEAIKEAAGALTKDQLKDLYPISGTPVEGFEYIPSEAEYMDLVGDQLGLNGTELAKLDANGFVVSSARQYENPTAAYLDIYYMDLPVIVTSDSILHAWHKSYDEILKEMEEKALIGWLEEIVANSRESLLATAASVQAPNEVIADLDLYLTVGASLLGGAKVSSLTKTTEVDDQVAEILGAIEAAEGFSYLGLFGATVLYDYSQFTVRGHYTESEELERYFKAMIWFGRTLFELTEPVTGKLNAEAFSAMCLLKTAVDEAGAAPLWGDLSRTIDLMVGEADSMDLHDANSLFGTLTLKTCEMPLDETAETYLETLLTAGYGAQQINSGWLMGNPYGEPTPLPPAFAFFGQRFVVDSYVFSNVVYDRISAKRMLPLPADALFVLGNNLALEILDFELDLYQYQGQLRILRFLVDAYDAGFWRSNLYNLWLGLIRSLTSNSYKEELPPAMQTLAWQYKTLQTQLASWSQLRHDTILYVKQSYTSGVPCEYPEGYVEPVPELYATLGGLASCSQDVLAGLALPDSIASKVNTYFQRVAEIAGILHQMSLKELAGESFTAEEAEFVESIVFEHEGGCDGPTYFSGWFADLHYANAENMIGNDAIIADVHTDPNSGSVLHVGTGYVDLMVFTTPTCSGPKAYVGPVFSYYEHVEPEMNRLNDDDWKDLLESVSPPEPPSWSTHFHAGTE